jgi:hypothetical protein
LHPAVHAIYNRIESHFSNLNADFTTVRADLNSFIFRRIVTRGSCPFCWRIDFIISMNRLKVLSIIQNPKSQIQNVL